MSKKTKKRLPIPRDIKRKLLIEAGFCCSVRGCTVSDSLEFHHIDGEAVNSVYDNLLVLCSNHHTLATKGMIDRKACQQIKKLISEAERNILSIQHLKPELRRVFREELSKAGFKEPIEKQNKNIFPSLFDRRRLISTLELSKGGPRDIYLSIRLLGELRYRGSTKAIIKSVERLKKNTPKKHKQKFYYDFYFPAVESLSKIGTKEALEWLASEFFKDDEENPLPFIIFSAIAGSKNSKRYIGFRKVSHKTWHEKGKEVNEGIYSMCGKKYKLKIVES